MTVEVFGPAGSVLSAGAITKVAATDLGGHRVVAILPDGTAGYAHYAVPAHMHAVLGVTVHAAVAGADVKIITFGELTEPTWNWTPGVPLYLLAAGVLSETVPTGEPARFIREVATTLTPTKIWVDPQPPIALA